MNQKRLGERDSMLLSSPNFVSVAAYRRKTICAILPNFKRKIISSRMCQNKEDGEENKGKTGNMMDSK